MKRITALILAILISSSLFACTRNDAKTSSFFAMDTFITLTSYDASAETFDRITRKITELDEILSRTKKNSDISRLNSAGTSPVSLSDDTAELMKLALSYCEKSHGVFDVTVAPLTDLWNVTSDNPTIPSPSKIASASMFVNYEYLNVNNNEARFLSEGMSCDLGGIAKGYVADKAVEILNSASVTSAMLQIGSSVYILGEKPDGSHYTVGIRDPEGDMNSYIGKLPLKNKYITSSGDYERYFELGGDRYCHIFDTATGYPIDNELRSVTVITDNGTEGDFLSTYLFCIGLERGLELCEAEGISAIFVTKDRRVFTKGEATAEFELTAGGYTYEK